MKTLTINMAAKKPRYGERCIPPQLIPTRVQMHSCYPPYTYWVDGPIDFEDCEISGKGIHEKLGFSRDLTVTVIDPTGKLRLRFTGYVKSTTRLPDGSTTTIKPDGRRFVVSKKNRRGKWKKVKW